MHTRRAGQGCSVDLVTASKPACCPALRMLSNATPTLALLVVQTNSDHALWLSFEYDLITDHHLASTHSEGSLSAHSYKTVDPK